MEEAETRGVRLEHKKGGERWKRLHGQVVDGHVCATFVRTWISSCPSGSLLEMRGTPDITMAEKQHLGNIILVCITVRSGRSGTQPLVMSGSQ